MWDISGRGMASSSKGKGKELGGGGARSLGGVRATNSGKGARASSSKG